MARYRYDAKVEAFPRDLLDEVVAALLDGVEGAPVTESGFAFGEDVHDEVRLVEGRHVATGARYRIAVDRGEGEVSVAAWNRAGESRIDVTGDFGGHIVRLCVELRMSGRRLQTVRVSGDYQGPKPFRMVRRAKWECEMQAEEWWAVLGSKTAPLSVRVAHPFAFADLRIARGKDKGGRWAVRTTARFGVVPSCVRWPGWGWPSCGAASGACWTKGSATPCPLGTPRCPAWRNAACESGSASSTG